MHGLPALRQVPGNEFLQVGMSRVNHTGKAMDAEDYNTQGLGNVPRLAGVHPIYLVRQLYHFREGTRKGPDAALMRRPSARLTDGDIVDLSAYAASLSPE